MSFTPGVGDDLTTLASFAEAIFNAITGRRGYYVGVFLLSGGAACV